MTYDDDFIQINFSGGTRRSPMTLPEQIEYMKKELKSSKLGDGLVVCPRDIRAAEAILESLRKLEAMEEK